MDERTGVRIEETEKVRVHPPIDKLTDALTFRLARLAAVNERAGNALFKQEYDLTINEWRVMGLTNAFQPVRFDQIRQFLVMDKGQLSRTVKALADRGIIETLPSQDDARKLELRLTAAGQALHDRVLVYAAERCELSVSAITPEECAEFLRILQKLSAHNEDLALLAGHLT